MNSVLALRNSKAVLVTLMLSFSVLFTSCGKSNTKLEIPGVDGPNVVLQEDNVIISMTFENLELEGGLRYAIPKYPNSYVAIEPDVFSTGTLMSISVSLDDVFDGSVSRLDPMTLPGGRNLPGVASGSLPAVAFSIEKFKNMAFYLGPKVFGVWVPLKKLGAPGAIITARFNSGSTRIGNISLVGEDQNGENAGFLLMLDISSYAEKRLKKLAKKY